MDTRVLTVAVAASLCACSCGPAARDTPSAQWAARDSAGVTVVFNHTDGAARGCITIAGHPQITIPSGPASPPLFRVRGGAILGDGGIVLLNAGTKQLLVFGPDGRFRRAVGRAGSGPGEFMDPRWLGRGDGDTLYVWDGRLMRLSMFDGAGDLVGVHQVRVGDERGLPVAISGRFADGAFLSAPGPLVFFDGTRGILRHPQPYGRYTLSTGVADSVTVGAGMEFVTGEGGVYELPFGKRDVVEPVGNLLVVGDDGTSVLRYYDRSGALRRRVNWVARPVPVTSRDRREYIRYVNSIFPSHAQRQERDTRFAEQRPLFSGMIADDLGWLWVRSWRGGWEAWGPWLVFDGEGVLRCSVDPPNGRFTALDIDASQVLGWQRDENDEESVVLHALIRGGE